MNKKKYGMFDLSFLNDKEYCDELRKETLDYIKKHGLFHRIEPPLLHPDELEMLKRWGIIKDE